jgi:hypothetical protein
MIQSPPDDLGESGKKLWNDVVGTWDLRADELEVLAAACRARDTVDRLNEELRDADLVVHGSQGQPVAHPLLIERRMNDAHLAQLLGKLRLPDPVTEPGPLFADDVPRGPMSRAEAARIAARARWDKRGQAS